MVNREDWQIAVDELEEFEKTIFCSCGWKGNEAPMKAVRGKRNDPPELEPYCPQCKKLITELSDSDAEYEQARSNQ